MLKNYFKIALRNLVKRKGYTLINISGLAIGVACCLLISIYVLNELRYDQFIEESDRIYRLEQTSISPSGETTYATSPFKTAPTLQAEYPRLIDQTVRFFNMQQASHTLLDEETENSWRESNFYFVDSTFFDVFPANLIQGNPEEVLSNPLSLVMTQERAEVYFGEENPIGKTLSFNGRRSMTFEVTGIMESWPEQSHMDIDMLAPFASVDILYRNTPDYDDSWWWNPVWTYVKLKEPAMADDLRAQLPAFADKYYHPNRPESEQVRLDLRPITDIHLYSSLEWEMEANGSIFYIYLFSAVALLILVIACVNFMNLATARSAERGREVGMRKVLGADRSQLFKQFMGESFLMSFIAVMLAVLLVYLILPYFNNFVDKELVFNLFENPFLLAGLIILVPFVALTAGIYPSLFLSRFQPSLILKGNTFKGSRGVMMRKGLVIFQFSLSVILIIGTIILYLQLQHMQGKNLGFQQEQIVLLPMDQNLIAWEFPQFKEQALQNPSIQSVTAVSKILGSSEQHQWKMYPANVPQGESRSTLALHVAHDFVETYDIEIIAGRPFSRDFQTDKDQAILVNQKMVEVLDIVNPENALGEPFYYEPSEGERVPLSVVGVVKDFNYTSLKKEIEPLIIRLAEGTRPILQTMSYAAVKIAPGALSEGIGHLEQVWSEVNYIDPFEYTFQDQELQKVYATEMRIGKVTGSFTLLCILVACLGLFGLASFTASKRTKEIGIRKTLGASLSSILVLLSKEYLKLVLIANIVAWPIIYFLVNGYLQSFPYRINLGWNLFLVFMGTVILSILICLATVSYQSMKAALINPVDSIKQE